MNRLTWKIARVFMFPVFHLILKPLIKRNYRLRAQSAMNGDGKHPDKWYWADSLAVEYGYFVRDYPTASLLASMRNARHVDAS